MDNKRILITGGASGIGLEIAKLFYKNHAQIAIVDYDQVALHEASKFFSETDLMIHGDINDTVSVRKIFNEIDLHWSGIDVLVNNAGISIPAPFEEIKLENWTKVLSINLTGNFLISQQATKRMHEQESGIIINIGSVSGNGRDAKLFSI